MKTFTPCLLCLLLLLPTGGVQAQEDSLLGRLDRECRALAARADAATVEIGPLSAPGVLNAHDWIKYVNSRPVPVSGAASPAILVGSPPRIVTALSNVGNSKEIAFRLADGTEGKAKLLGRDSDFGLAVFTLPEEMAKGRSGLSVDRSECVERGRLVLVNGTGGSAVYRPLGLAITRGSSTLGDWFYVDGLAGATKPGQPVIGANGQLIGIAAGRVGDAWGSPYPYITSTTENLAWRLIGAAGDPVREKQPAVVPLASKFRTYSYTPAVRHVPGGAFLAGSVIARVLDDLAEHGRVRHSYLGVVSGAARGKGEERGVEIRSVMEGSPAAKAGIVAGARVRTLDGRPVASTHKLSRILVLKRPGETIRIGVIGKADEIEVVLGDRAAAVERLVTARDLGLVCVGIGDQLASFLGLPDGTRGVVVNVVRADSPAVQAGIKRGHVIVASGGEPIADLQELEAVIAGAKGEIEFEILSGDKRFSTKVRVPEPKVGSRTR